MMFPFPKAALSYPLLSICMSTMSSALSTSAASKRRIAAIAQLRSTSSKYRNLLDVAHCARLAKLEGASMLFLPECFGFMGESSEQTLKNAEQPIMDGTTNNDERISLALRRMIEDNEAPDSGCPTADETEISLIDGLRIIARESGLWISGGGMHVIGGPPDEKTGRKRVQNTHVIMDSSGDVKCAYQKIHLFDVSIPGKVELRESATTAPGTNLVVCDSPLGKLGLSTCYDVRFPEMYTSLVQRGAQILLVPSAFTVPTGQQHWHILLQARAIENQCYVIASAQFGEHNVKRTSFGHSLAVDPWGTIVADAGGYGRAYDDDRTNKVEPDQLRNLAPKIVTCEIDHDLIESVRNRMPIQLHRDNAKF